MDGLLGPFEAPTGRSARREAVGPGDRLAGVTALAGSIGAIKSMEREMEE
jgi:hypothetical protein